MGRWGERKDKGGRGGETEQEEATTEKEETNARAHTRAHTRTHTHTHVSPSLLLVCVGGDEGKEVNKRVCGGGKS